MRGRGARPTVTWIDSAFSSTPLAGPSGIVELSLASQTDLGLVTLNRGTILQIYGEMIIQMYEAEALGAQAVGAWGIRLKEQDATTTTTAFSPLDNGDETAWMMHRQFSLIKPTGAATYPVVGAPYINHTPFNIRNPRKMQFDDELVCIIATSGASEDIRYSFWCRTLVKLP